MIKLFFGMIGLFLCSSLYAQSGSKSDQHEFKIEGSTSSLPEGTEWKNGKIMIKPGYVATYFDTSHMVTIRSSRAGATGTGGWFACLCKSSNGSCLLSPTPQSVSCLNNTCKDCYMAVIIKTKGITEDERRNFVWKRLIVPPRTN